MKFGDLTQSVIALWEFLAYPFAELFLLIGITRIVWGPEPFSFVAKAVEAYSSLIANPPMHTVLDTYGITKLLPIVSLIVITLVLHLIHRMVLAVMNALPPGLATMSPQILQYVDPPSAAFVWCSLHVTAIHELEALMENVVEKAKAEKSWIVQRYLSWSEKRSGMAHFRFNFAKLLFVWTFLVSIFSYPIARVRHPHIGAAFLIMLLLILFAAAQFFLLIQYTERVIQAKFIVAKSVLQSRDDFSYPAPEALRNAEEEFVLQCGMGRWWRLRYYGDGFYSFWKSRKKVRRWRLDEQMRLRAERHQKAQDDALKVPSATEDGEDFYP